MASFTKTLFQIVGDIKTRFTKKEIIIAMCVPSVPALVLLLSIFIMYHKARNPVIHSPQDITSELLRDIEENNLDSLTFDYIFTDCPEFGGELLGGKVKDLLASPIPWKEWVKLRKYTNPFMRVNEQKPIKRIDFEIKFTKSVETLNCAFINFEELQYVNIKDVSNIHSARSMFENAIRFNQPLDHWDTSNMSDMSYMFHNALSFNQPIGSWNTSKVYFMKGMFERAKSFNQPIGNWDTSLVQNMSDMFSNAISFNQPIGNWNTSQVTNMEGMFYNAKSFNQPVGNWDTSKVTTLNYMFLGADSYSHPKPKGAN